MLAVFRPDYYLAMCTVLPLLLLATGIQAAYLRERAPLVPHLLRHRLLARLRTYVVPIGCVFLLAVSIDSLQQGRNELPAALVSWAFQAVVWSFVVVLIYYLRIASGLGPTLQEAALKELTNVDTYLEHATSTVKDCENLAAELAGHRRTAAREPGWSRRERFALWRLSLTVRQERGLARVWLKHIQRQKAAKSALEKALQATSKPLSGTHDADREGNGDSSLDD